jgi:UPF0716 family protein affecting phage T7 exclusion
MIYFLVYIFLEVLITINIGGAIGGILTFVEIIATLLLGIFYIANFKYSMGSAIFELAKKEITKERFVAQNMTSFLGAILLILPGMLSDIIGILLQIPMVSDKLAELFFKRNSNQSYTQNKRNNNENIIDVEAKDTNSSS